MTMKTILDKTKSQAESAEVVSHREISLSVSYENNVIKDSSTSDLGGTAVRVIKNGKIGFSSSSEPGDEKIADYVLDLAEYGKEVTFDFSSDTDVKPFDVDTSSLDAITEDFAITECDKVVEELKTVHDEALAMCSLGKTLSESRIMTSKGLDFSQKSTLVSWFCGLMYNTEGNFLQVYDFDVGEKYTGFEPQVKQVKENFALCENPVSIKPGKYRVLFTPRGMLNLVAVWMSCLNGLSVVKGISPWGSRIGEQMFDERISVLTDLVSETASKRLALDDEGTPTGITTLIDKGILTSFLHSRDTASQLNQQPTGHAFKGSFAATPSPAAAGFEFASGDDDLEDMTKDADLWVDDLMGSMMSNPFSGIINGNVSQGFKMENGKKVTQIKNAMMSVNVFDLFKSGVAAVSKEVKTIGMPPYYPTFKTPYFLIDGVSIAAK